jgi:hypothetical protein
MEKSEHDRIWAQITRQGNKEDPYPKDLDPDVDVPFIKPRHKSPHKRPNKTLPDEIKDNAWEPGQSGNPTGIREPKLSLSNELKKHLRRHPEDVRAILLALIAQAKRGNMVATKEILDRIDGKVAEKHQIEGEMPIKLLFVPATTLLDKPDSDMTIELESKDIRELPEGE